MDLVQCQYVEKLRKALAKAIVFVQDRVVQLHGQAEHTSSNQDRTSVATVELDYKHWYKQEH